MLPLEYSAILLTFMRVQVVVTAFILSTLEWPFYTSCTVLKVTTKLTIIR